ncbi:MAG TPA: hypothetical protein VJV03_08745 [Pyrinomonadaceae bacterium]|nr:hypothetical protein [Pyrinomonadaceae bacterium]
MKITFLTLATLILVVSTPAVTVAQKINSLTSAAKGSGRLNIANVDTHKLTGALVILRENGAAEITLYSNGQIYGQGKWSEDAEHGDAIDLNITGGLIRGNAIGTGKLFLDTDRKSIVSLKINAQASGNNVSVEFIARKKTKSDAVAVFR